ncbi:DNA replication complex subunit Gins51 [Natronococcus roseus]|uniref:DNA replication complex subunit Gins51 n=1 Tax=Natronococcus roseus TaxID=1052014 RepID=UPI00374D35DE
MNLDELRSVQSKERQKDSLQNLRPSFYQEVGEYIAELEAERDRAAERADDPFSSPEVSRLTDEIETAKDVVEAIYERRMGKLVKQASLAAAGMAANDEGLTAEEADLFDDLVDRIDANKTRVLDVLEGLEADPDPERESGPASEPESDPVSNPPTDSTRESSRSAAEPDASTDDAPPAPPMEPDPTDDDAAVDPTTLEPDDASPAADAGESESEVTAADVMGGAGPATADASEEAPRPDGEPPSPVDAADDGAATPDGSDSAPGESIDPDLEGGQDDPEPAAEDAVDRVTVRMTRDVGSILGVDDREYTLSSDDVVMLPEQNASPLLERDAAERLD